MSLSSDILGNFEAEVSSLKLVPSSGGCFEVSVDADLVFSKLAMGRHAEPGEVLSMIRKKLSTNAGK